MNSILRRRRALMGAKTATPILPAEYQQVEWIGRDTTNASPTLSINVALRTGDEITVDCRNDVLSGTQRRAMIGYSNVFAFSQSHHSESLYVWQCSLISSNLTDDRDGGTIRMTSASASGFNVGNYNNTNSYAYKGVFFGVTVTRSGNIILNLVPCYRKSDGATGMYDTVNGNFYATNGTWTKGTDVT